MNKDEFEKKIEKAAAKVESKIENQAERFDNAVTRASHNRIGKILILAINVVITIALLISGSVLICYGYTAWAIVCFVLGGLALIWHVIEAILFRN